MGTVASSNTPVLTYHAASCLRRRYVFHIHQSEYLKPLTFLPFVATCTCIEGIYEHPYNGIEESVNPYLSLLSCAPFCTKLGEMPKQLFQRRYVIAMWSGVKGVARTVSRNKNRLGELNKNLSHALLWNRYTSNERKAVWNNDLQMWNLKKTALFKYGGDITEIMNAILKAERHINCSIILIQRSLCQLQL
jgi:hypothetical protein